MADLAEIGHSILVAVTGTERNASLLHDGDLHRAAGEIQAPGEVR